MLSIGRAPRRTPVVDDDPFDALLECHSRIRRFARLATALGERSDERSTLVQDAARDVHRYFTIALPLHVADEDGSLTTELLAAGRSTPLAVVLLEMQAQHGRIDHALERLAPMWRELAAGCALSDAGRAALRMETRALVSLLDEHLKLEETLLFPAARATLDAAARARVLAAMRARRLA